MNIHFLIPQNLLRGRAPDTQNKYQFIHPHSEKSQQAQLHSNMKTVVKKYNKHK